ncbi:MAG: hypothetical protein JWR60_3698 [Polaromonas sp.]|nr:hypothetical protein [Polaromonas sp.]
MSDGQTRLAMTLPEQFCREATSVIVHDVKAAHQQDYEPWMVTACNAHQAFPGYLATDIIRPIDPQFLRYVILMRFSTLAQAQAWLVSDVRQQLLTQARPWLIKPDRYQAIQGADFWFDPGLGEKHPRRWKQWLLSVVALLPLATLVPVLISAAFSAAGIELPASALHLLSLAIISGLMVYLLIPGLTRLLAKWLVA